MSDQPYRYNPLLAPDPGDWLAMDEDERIYLVSRYHRRRRPRAPSPELHVLTHVIVENQAAMADGPAVAETIARLLTEGLDRHQAVHAIGVVLAPLFNDLFTGIIDLDEFNSRYSSGLSHMTAERWLLEDS